MLGVDAGIFIRSFDDPIIDDWIECVFAILSTTAIRRIYQFCKGRNIHVKCSLSNMKSAMLVPCEVHG